MSSETDVPSPTARPARRRLRTALAVLVPVALVVAAAGAYWFQPWRLFTNTTVVEALPGASAPPVGQTRTSPAPSAAPTPSPTPSPAPPAATPPPPPPAAPPPFVEVARGDLIPHEHETSGAARLLELPDGSRVLRLEGLDTSDGPDLRVWLTDAPVVEGRDGWFLFDDGRSLDLGALEGNRGDQNYEIPPDADIAGLTSVSIWCRRFAVSFGAAELAST